MRVKGFTAVVVLFVMCLVVSFAVQAVSLDSGASKTVPMRGVSGIKPGDVTLDIVLDETAKAGELTDAMVREVKFVVTRNIEQGLKGKLTLGFPKDTPGGGAPVVMPFDLTKSKTAELKMNLQIPSSEGTLQVTYPLELTVDNKKYMTMDFIVLKALAWKIIGPFEGGPDAAHDKVFPPEEKIDFSGKYPGKGGKEVSWKPFPANAIGDRGFYSFNDAYTDNDFATGYAAIDIFSPSAMDAKLKLGSDDSIKVWQNGKLIHDKNILRPAEPGQDVVDITLEEGKNTFLLKVCEGEGGWGFFFNVVGKDDKPIKGLNPSIALTRAFLTDPVFRATAMTQTSASFKWRSDVPNTPKLVVQKAIQGRALPYPGPTPKKDMVKPDPNAKPIIVQTKSYSMDHTATVTGLEPGTRYIAYTEPAIGNEPSETYSFYTNPPTGKTQVLHLKVVCMVFPNVIYEGSEDKESSKTPIEASEIDRLKWQLRQTALFYYINSGMRMTLDIEYLVDDRNYVIKDDDIYGVAYHEVHNKGEKLIYEVAERNGRKVTDYDGLVMVSYAKKWDQNIDGGKGGWVYPHGGGGTIGPDPATGLGKCGWRAGRNSNDAWLMCHEFQHQLDALYHESMAPEHLFNHFQPWDDTAHRHGEHWDGNGWIFWEWAGYVTREHQGYPLLEPKLGFRYFVNRWGTVVQYDDKDNDGIPDDAANLPLDEKRFNSDPTKADTDGDGLSDMMEVMACRWLEYGLGATWAGDPKTHYCNPRNPDSDGDGLKDGIDPYPIYPINHKIKKSPNAKGVIERKNYRPFVAVNDKAFSGKYYLSWNDEYFVIGIETPKKPRRFRICLDNDDNGWYVGADNYDMVIFSNGDARWGKEWHGNEEKTFIYGFHNCGVKDKWPFYDADGLKDGEIQYTQEVKEDGSYVGEIRIPKNEKNGLSLKAGEKIGILLTINPEGGIQRPGDFNELSVFEPHSFFAVELAR